MGGDTALWQVIATSGYAHKITEALLIAPLPWVGEESWQSLSYLPSAARAGSDAGKGIAQKMARHKQCQKLRGSRNADLTAAQGVTHQNLLRHNTTTTPPKGGRAGNKTTLNDCFRAS